MEKKTLKPPVCKLLNWDRNTDFESKISGHLKEAGYLWVSVVAAFSFPVSDWKLLCEYSQYIGKRNKKVKIWHMLHKIMLGYFPFMAH